MFDSKGYEIKSTKYHHLGLSMMSKDRDHNSEALKIAVKFSSCAMFTLAAFKWTSYI